MLRSRTSGFTLIELMVVIVIIGVLASLAIPRFTEASAKAKMSEAPRVLASFESAVGAAQAEGVTIAAVDDLILKIPGDGESKWWKYAGSNWTSGPTLTSTAENAMGKFAKNGTLVTAYIPVATTGTGGDCFTHTSSDSTTAVKMVPNFFKTAACAAVTP